jgi:hypothetical protein
MTKTFYKKILSILTIVLGVLLLNSCQKEFSITVMPDDESHGTVNGGGVYKEGSVIEIWAVPATGYRFERWDDGNTNNPRAIMVEKNATYTAIFVSEGGGGGEEPTSMYVFSVSETQKVIFSPGNLQWSATNGGSTPTTHVVADGTAAGTWRFAPNQLDTIYSNNKYISDTYTDWIDLFCWGTSGYNNKYPYMIGGSGYNYGNGAYDIAGTNYDWGVYNAIYNPKTNTTDVPGTWRTLTKDEWVYLLDDRTTSSGVSYVKAVVCGIPGLVIFPDNWSSPICELNYINIENTPFTANMINATDWAKMEAVGCVFLPTNGYLGMFKMVVGARYIGCYWTSTVQSSDCSYDLYFTPDEIDPLYLGGREVGCSVRLVKDVQ